jgi:hypothetical protein
MDARNENPPSGRGAKDACLSRRPPFYHAVVPSQGPEVLLAMWLGRR